MSMNLVLWQKHSNDLMRIIGNRQCKKNTTRYYITKPGHWSTYPPIEKPSAANGYIFSSSKNPAKSTDTKHVSLHADFPSGMVSIIRKPLPPWQDLSPFEYYLRWPHIAIWIC